MSNTKTKPQLIVPSGHTDFFRFSSFAPNGKFLLTGSKDQSIKLWNLQGKLIKTLRDDKAAICGKLIGQEEFITGYWEGAAKRWNLLTGASELIFEKLDQEVIAISEGGSKICLYAGERNGRLTDINKQISIWDTQKSKHFICEPSHSMRITKAIFSKDGNRVITTSYDKTIKIWNASDQVVNGKGQGQVIHTLEGHKEEELDIAISPDGATIVSGAGFGELIVWDAIGGLRKPVELKGHQEMIEYIQFAEDGATFLTACMEKMIFWDAKTFQQLGKPFTRNKKDRRLDFSPDLRNMLVINHPARFVDLSSGETSYELQGETCQISHATVSFENDIIAINSSDGWLRFWSFNTNQPTINRALENYNIIGDNYLQSLELIQNTGELLLMDSKEVFQVLDKHDFSSTGEEVYSKDRMGVYKIDLSSDGKKAAIGVYENKQEPNNTALIVDRINKKRLHSLPVSNDGDPCDSLAFSHSGDKLLTAVRDGNIIIWDVASGGEIKKIPCGEEEWNSPRSVTWSGDDTKIAAGLENGWIYVWDIETNYERKGYHSSFNITSKQAGESYDRVEKIVFSPDGSKIGASYYDSRTFIIWDVETGEECLVIKDHLVVGEMFFPLIFFTEDSQIMFTGAGGNAIFIWDVHACKKVASLYFLAENDWAISTPSGLFDASEGAMNILYYVNGFEIIELDQLKDRYYEPGLLTKILEGGPQSLRDVSTLNDVDLYPEVEASINVDQLNIKLKERSGGLGKVELYINGKIVWEDKNEAKGTSFSIDLKNYNKYFSTREENRIALRVYNEEGWLVSPETLASRIDDAGAKAAGRGGAKKKKKKRSKAIQHKLYALFIGTGTYRGSGMNLKYPEKDAAAMAKAVGEVGQNLFGATNQDIRLLTTKATDKAKKPSRANIKKALNDFAAVATADDVCFIYMSGHGDNWGSGEKAQFYYLTYEMISGDISDSGIRASQTISSSEIAEWTNKIACKLQVLVLDACHSGKVVDSLLAGKKAVDSARIKALDRMKDRTGMFVLAGSPGDKVSYETSHFGQGLLTYSLLFGMKGASHVIEGSDKFIDVMKLLQYSRDRVPQLAKEIDKVQQPILATPKGGDSFDIGIYDSNVKINLASRRPIIIQSFLISKTSYYDDLDISVALDQRLLQENAYANTARLTFVNIARFKNAYTVRGVYEEKGSNIEVDIKIYQEGKEKQKFKLSKAKTAIKNLVEDIVDKLAMLPV